MIFTGNNIILLAAALSTALMAGLFFNWTNAITGGLHKLPDSHYISAMQSINRAIQNPVFFLAFFGAAVLLSVSSYLQYQSPLSVTFYLVFGATIFYLCGVMAVTVFGNIPLNQTLDKFNLDKATPEEIYKLRLAFESKWNSLNTIRTVASFISLLLILIACINTRTP